MSDQGQGHAPQGKLVTYQGNFPILSESLTGFDEVPICTPQWQPVTLANYILGFALKEGRQFNKIPNFLNFLEKKTQNFPTIFNTHARFSNSLDKTSNFHSFQLKQKFWPTGHTKNFAILPLQGVLFTGPHQVACPPTTWVNPGATTVFKPTSTPSHPDESAMYFPIASN